MLPYEMSKRQGGNWFDRQGDNFGQRTEYDNEYPASSNRQTRDGPGIGRATHRFLEGSDEARVLGLSATPPAPSGTSSLSSLCCLPGMADSEIATEMRDDASRGLRQRGVTTVQPGATVAGGVEASRPDNKRKPGATVAGGVEVLCPDNKRKPGAAGGVDASRVDHKRKLLAADLIQYKGRYGELIAQADAGEFDLSDELRGVLTALAYGSLADIHEPLLKELPQEVLEYLDCVSLVHAVTTHGRTLTYDLLLPLLRLPSDASLESLVIDAIYKGFLQATIDSAARTLTVSSWAARETDPAVIPQLVGVLDQWMSRSEAVIAQSTAKAAEEDEKLAAIRKAEREVADELVAARVALEEESKEAHRGGRSGSRGGIEAMLAPLGGNNGRSTRSGGRFGMSRGSN